jgi:hypothetical protein
MATKADTAWKVFLLFPILILICETLGLSVGQSSVEEYRLQSHGRVTDGTAFFTEYKAAGKAGGAYYVRYIFDYNGIRYKGEWQTSEAWVHATKLPANIHVRFLPENPAISWPPDVGVHRSLVLNALFLLVCLFVAAYLGAKVFLAWRRTGMRRWALAIALIVSSLVLTALCVFDIAPLLTAMLGLGCVIVAAGLSPLCGLPAKERSGHEG